jgi:hypothetical protein
MSATTELLALLTPEDLAAAQASADAAGELTDDQVTAIAAIARNHSQQARPA